MHHNNDILRRAYPENLFESSRRRSGHRSGGGAHKEFQSRQPVARNEPQLRCRGGRGTEKETIVRRRAGRGAQVFVGQSVGGQRRRLGVRHLEIACYAAGKSRPAFGCYGSLLLQPRLTEVYVAVDESREKHGTAGVESLRGPESGSSGSRGHDKTAVDGHPRVGDKAAGIDQSGIADYQVGCHAHFRE